MRRDKGHSHKHTACAERFQNTAGKSAVCTAINRHEIGRRGQRHQPVHPRDTADLVARPRDLCVDMIEPWLIREGCQRARLRDGEAEQCVLHLRRDQRAALSVGQPVDRTHIGPGAEAEADDMGRMLLFRVKLPLNFSSR